MNFDPKRVNETDIFTVDYVNRLLPGETIQSAAWTISAVGASDPNAATMIHGNPLTNGSAVAQLITGGIPGVRYAPICTAQTSAGRTLVLPRPGDGQLDITL